MARALALQQPRARDPLVQLAGVPDRGELVGAAADDRGGHPVERLDAVELVEVAEAREEVGDHLERRRRQHLVNELEQLRGHLIAEREPVGDDRGDGGAGLAGGVDGAVTPLERGDGSAGDPAGQPGRQHRQQDPAGVQAAGRGRDQADADDPVTDQLGELLGERHDRHPAHGVSDQHDGAVGRHVVDHLLQVTAELVDGGVRTVGAAGPAVRALVEVDRADQSAVGGALEVPAVEVEAQPVDEDHGDIGLSGAPTALGRPVRRVDLVDLHVKGDAVVGHDGERLGPQRSEGDVRPRTAIDRPLLSGDGDGGPGGAQADGGADRAEDPASGAHAGPPRRCPTGQRSGGGEDRRGVFMARPRSRRTCGSSVLRSG